MWYCIFRQHKAPILEIFHRLCGKMCAIKTMIPHTVCLRWFAFSRWINQPLETCFSRCLERKSKYLTTTVVTRCPANFWNQVHRVRYMDFNVATTLESCSQDDLKGWKTVRNTKVWCTDSVLGRLFFLCVLATVQCQHQSNYCLRGSIWKQCCQQPRNLSIWNGSSSASSCFTNFH